MNNCSVVLCCLLYCVRFPSSGGDDLAVAALNLLALAMHAAAAAAAADADANTKQTGLSVLARVLKTDVELEGMAKLNFMSQLQVCLHARYMPGI